MLKAKPKKMCITTGKRILMSSDVVEIINELEEHYTIRFYRVGNGVLTDTIKKEYLEVIDND